MNTSAISVGQDGRRVSRKRLRAGWLVSAVPALFLGSGGFNMFIQASFVMEGFKHYGYPETIVAPLGLVVFASVVLYLIPRTALLGALLLTGYLGGATSSHLRMSEAFFPPLIAAAIIWVGLCLRDDRVARLITGRPNPA